MKTIWELCHFLLQGLFCSRWCLNNANDRSVGLQCGTPATPSKIANTRGSHWIATDHHDPRMAAISQRITDHVYLAAWVCHQFRLSQPFSLGWIASFGYLALYIQPKMWNTFIGKTNMLIFFKRKIFSLPFADLIMSSGLYSVLTVIVQRWRYIYLICIYLYSRAN